MPDYEPSYLALHASGELRDRAERALALLEDRCRVCPRLCKVDRLNDQPGLCRVGRHAVVASHFPHFGEENCLRGVRGSGTIFFSGCNLRCVFCVPPGTLIATKQGPRPIDALFSEASEEIRRGDGLIRRPDGLRVYTLTGELAPASKVFRHRYRGELVRVKPLSAPAVSFTPNHGVFVAHRSDLERIEKVPAGSLTQDHLLVVPKRVVDAEPWRLDLGEMHHESQLVATLSEPETSRDVRRGLGYALVPIHSIERKPYEGHVYNLEVHHPSHSYLAPAVAVANCQNHDISWQLQGERVTPKRLAAMMLELQQIGCHNINWVTPEHVVPQILEALPLAVDGGLRLPTVYNTSSYDSPESLELMDGVVDVYMPDFKLWSPDLARRYLAKRDYAEVARHSVREMKRQVGDLVLGEDGMAKRGLLVRHLVMPGALDETEAILRFIATELGPGTYVNLMAQYYPAGRTSEFPEIDRHLDRSEFERALELADGLGLRQLDQRSRAAVSRLAPA